jgi:tRNA A-37 threonylcarbamoyl transferase component Bud32
MKNNMSPLTKQLAEGIQKSKVVVCCLNKLYYDSKNCLLELEYCNAIGKQMIILFLEKMPIEELGGVGFIIAGLVRLNCYKHPTSWHIDDLETIKQAVLDNLEIYREKHEIVGDNLLIKGRYERIEMLGEGSQAIAFKVRDVKESAANFKALKMFNPITASAKTKSIDREVELLRNLNHPNIIEYLDFFHESTGPAHSQFKIYYLLTTYYEDGTLADEIAFKKARTEPVQLHDLYSWCIQILQGIEYLHSKEVNIIHRDLKPGNIFLSRRNLVLGDLGHAKFNEKANSKKLKSKADFGTDGYVAYEVIAGDIDHTEKIDIW